MRKIWQRGCPQFHRVWCFKALMVLVMVLCTAAVNATVTLQGMRVASFAANTRLVFDCDQSPEYKILPLYQPTRLVVDFPKARWRGAQPVLSSKDQQIKAIRVTCGENARTAKVCAAKGATAPQHVRVVLDLKQPVATDVFVLPPVSKPRYRLVVDLMGKGTKQPGGVRAQKPVKKAKVAALSPTLSVPTLVHRLSDRSRPVVVVIDPGHGGKDPGATGLWGTHEKDVALRIAKSLQSQLNARPGFKAYLTRDRDVFVPLRQRLEKARHYHADMFVSIHADAFRKRSAAGASVYALSAHGATSEAARWLAASENSAELMGGVSLDDKGNVLRGVLLDLSQTATTTAV